MASQEQSVESIYPLTPLQQGMLFEALLAPESGVYFSQFLYTLAGELQASALQQAWERVVQRHPALRTLFVWKEKNKPLQVVRRRMGLPWQYDDWRVFSDAEQQAKLEELLAADRREGFDLSRAPLMRLRLIRMTEDRHELIWSLHHLLLDGWSVALIRGEVLSVYQAICEGRESLLKPSRSYGDYIRWLQEQDLSKAESFWRDSLKGFSAPTPLVVDHARGGQSRQIGDVRYEELEFPTEATNRLKLFCRQQNLTLSTLVQGAWALLLSRYSGHQDVLFGSVVSGRPADLQGVESVVGMFINTLPVRARFADEDVVSSWLSNFQIQLAEMREYEHSPLVEVQGWSQVPRGLPLFESVLDFTNYPVESSFGHSHGGLQLSRIRAIEKTNYPLFVAVAPGEKLTVQIAYDVCRFNAEAITRLLGHYRKVLEGMVANPEQRVSEVGLLTEPEREQILMEWNRTEVDYPKDRCLHELIEEQVERAPEAVAVVFKEARLTYGQLNQRANQLAHHLQKLGVGPDSLVCLCLERSLNLVVGVLGVLKAGGAYVPLDPAYPTERLGFILADARPKVLLSETQFLPALSSLKLGEQVVESPAIICLDQLLKTGSEGPDTRTLERKVRPENLAYVIYTSGSTGKPKGVQVEHRSVVNFLDSMRRTPGFSASDVLLAVTTLCFDIAGLELLLPLTTGARVLIASRDVTVDGLQLARLLQESGVTVMQATPATWRLLIEAGWKGNPRFKVLCGGEAWTQDLAEALLTRCGSLWNMYGPTETTIWSSVCEVTRGQPVLIGLPIANTQFYVLDKSLQPVPVGVPGELHIGGHGVARGYANRPELTAEKFVMDPFAQQVAARMYKTGDWVKYRGDGTIEYLGRIDHQVKVRGFRIELGEIESLLAAHPGLRENVVVVRQDGADEKQLVAYAVAAAQPAPEAVELRRYLLEKLPEYMVPSLFVLLPALPRLPNGKIDRKALPASARAVSTGTTAKIAPQDELEQRLVRIWERVLGVRPIGVRDNFFDLGGHSLLAVRLFLEIKKALKRELPLATLFQGPTVEQLARLLRDTGWVAPFRSLVPIQPEGNKTPFFCVHGGGGNVLLFRGLSRYLGSDYPFYGLQSQGLDGTGQCLRRVEDMAARYLEELREVQPKGPYYLGGFCMGGSVAYEMAQQLNEMGQKVALLALFDTYNHNGTPPDRSLGKRMLDVEQKISFHWLNIRQLSFQRRAAYFDTKIKEAIRRRVGRLRIHIINLFSRSRSGQTRVAFLEDLNDQAGFAYRPRVYPQKVTLFQHQHNFSSLGDPQKGWANLAAGGLDVIEVPASPGGMFVEPYVQIVAAKLKACLEQAQGRPCSEDQAKPCLRERWRHGLSWAAPPTHQY